MSTTFHEAPTVPLPIVRARPRARLQRLADAIKRALAERALAAAEQELYALDDRTLADMGLDRSEIGSILRDNRYERINGVAN